MRGRIFDGKLYMYYSDSGTKIAANKTAKLLRKYGDYARVIHDRSGKYTVWVRKK